MASPGSPVILVVGGYGAFGIKVAERLARSTDLRIAIAGRSPDKARAAAGMLSRASGTDVASAGIDAQSPSLDTLRKLSATVIVNASGPFQSQDYGLARAAIAVGSHYVDLADARGFVTGITALDSQARAADVLVTSGASSVPALAAAIIDHYAPAFKELHAIEHAIAPANGYDPGVATTASILSGLGKSMPLLVDGEWTTAHGWSELRRVALPGLGTRWMGPCDVPDIELFPQHYPGVRTVRFSAGLEVGLFQLSLWMLARLVRAGLPIRPERLAGPLTAMKRALGFLGSDTGGMVVRLEGKGPDGRPLAKIITLIARDNVGPNVPAIAAVIVARKLARGALSLRGAMPCLGMVTLDEFTAEVADLPIEISVAEA